jgi:hypothetical protein
MTPAEFGRNGAKKRWAKADRTARLNQGRRMTNGKEQEDISMPRLQDTLAAQVLAMASRDPNLPLDRIAIVERVKKRLTEDEDDDATPAPYFGRQLRACLVALQEYADEFDCEGQREKAVQIHMVILKQLKGLPTEALIHSSRLSPATEAAIEAAAARLSDEELARAVQQNEQGDF